jgi:hypothetical protein
MMEISFGAAVHSHPCTVIIKETCSLVDVVVQKFLPILVYLLIWRPLSEKEISFSLV